MTPSTFGCPNPTLYILTIVAHRNSINPTVKGNKTEIEKTKLYFAKEIVVGIFLMGRWVRPEVYPLMAAMTFVTSLCVFQLTRNVFLNPDVRVNKAHRRMAVLENEEEGQKYAEHGLRKFLRTRPPEIMPTINHFFSHSQQDQ